MSGTPENKEAVKPKELQKEVAEKYELEGATIRSFFPGFGEMDLSQTNLKQADLLVKNGFKWLVLKDTKPKSTPVKTS